MIDYIQGLFVIVNTIISLYILIYAYTFLLKTDELPLSERRPWILLVIGAFFFLFSQVLGIIATFGPGSIVGIGISFIRIVFEFIYGGVILLAFITQSHLIILKDIVVIMKRLKDDRKENELEKDLDKDIGELSKKFYK